MGRTPPPHPIAIAGMHRSGTSMVTRALHDAGLHLIGRDAAELIRAAEDNPEGFWENKAIVACNDDLLEATGGAWDHPPELLPQGADDPRVRGVVEPARAALAGLREHDRWGFKDPRVCLTAPFWIDLEPELRFVICVRHPLEVALSLKRRNQNSYSLGLALWERYYTEILAAVPREHRILSHYDSFFVDPDRELARVCTFAGLDPATATVRGDLRHHTIDVGLADAGVGPAVQALYADLCREAGVAAPPEPPPDEGRVRRRLLDGEVAARHADQRQAAIERLEARELEFRAEYGASEEALRTHVRDLRRQYGTNEESLRSRVRDLERQVLAAREMSAGMQARVQGIDSRTNQMAKQLRVVEHEVSPGPLRRFARRAARTTLRTSRRVIGEGRAKAVPAARRALAKLPEPTRDQLRRVRRGAADPVPAARAASRRALPAAQSRARTQALTAARRLPPPAQQRLRITWQRVRRVRAAPGPAAQRAVAKLPDPAQAATRRAWRASAPLRRRGARVARRIGPAPRGAPRAPKGPPARDWKAGYQELVRSTVPAGAAWAVAMPGSPAAVCDVHSPAATRFPDTPRGTSLPDDLSHIAHLEALHCAGHRYLVVPEGSRPWFRQQAELRDHVVGTYRCLDDRPDAGAVFDLDAPAAPTHRSLRGEVRRLTAAAEHDPAVLVWTDLDIAGELPGVTTFRPPAGGALPYVDDSIELVVRDELHDGTEARRVATVGVVTVAAGAGGIEVRGVDDLAPSGSRAPRVLVRACTADADGCWARALARRVADAGADLELTTRPERMRADGHDVVLLVEPDVLPFPGAIEAAAAWASEHPDGAVTGKVLRADGRMESAGGTVFFDRSVALVVEGSDAVRAPWHDYARPVCWAPGFVAASAALWERVAGPEDAPVRTFVREWCAGVWAAGGSVVYDPALVAVRVAGRGGEASVPLPESAWQRVLDLRPRRPEHLGDGEWRYLLAHDDVEACRG
jgi:hypothetical protein